MSLSDRAIVTLAEAKVYAGMNLSDTTDDTTYETWIEDLSKEIEEIIENKVNPQSVTEYTTGDGTAQMVAGFYPVITPEGGFLAASFQYKSTYSGSWTNITSNATAIVVDSNYPWMIRLLDGSTWPYDEYGYNVKMSYTAGYSTVPGTIRDVALEMFLWKFKNSNKQRANNALGVSTVSETNPAGSSSVSFEAGKLRETWEKRLAKYKRLC